MAGEPEIALGVLLIANRNSTGIATYKRAYAEIPGLVALDTGNYAASVKRPGERMWQQIVRNIKSHDKDAGNFINEGYLTHVPRVGYRATDAGRAYLKRRGLE